MIKKPLTERDSLIQIGIEIIKRSYDNFDPDNFDKIKVLKGIETSLVAFTSPVKYIPYNSIHFYDALVDVKSKVVSTEIISNPNDYSKIFFETDFFSRSRKSEKIIQYVLDVFYKSKLCNTSDIEKYVQQMEENNGKLTIYDKFFYYEIEEDYRYSGTKYQINKFTGKLSMEGQWDGESFDRIDIVGYIELKK